MNKADHDELRPEYDFSKMSGGVRGKYVESYREGTNLALLEPDLAEAFPTDNQVNAALRSYLRSAEEVKAPEEPPNKADPADQKARPLERPPHWPLIRGPFAGGKLRTMPELSRFFGIVIRMFAEPGAPHHRPHFHAYHQGKAGIYAIDEIERIAGELPRRQDRLVLAWSEIHQEDLSAAWSRLQTGRIPNKIDPLE